MRINAVARSDFSSYFRLLQLALTVLQLQIQWEIYHLRVDYMYAVNAWIIWGFVINQTQSNHQQKLNGVNQSELEANTFGEMPFAKIILFAMIGYTLFVL